MRERPYKQAIKDFCASMTAANANGDIALANSMLREGKALRDAGAMSWGETWPMMALAITRRLNQIGTPIP